MTSAYIEDPPAYIRNTSAYKELVSAYKEPIHLQAFRLEAMNSYAVNRHLHIRALGQQQELPSVCTYRSIVADRLAMRLLPSIRPTTNTTHGHKSLREMICEANLF